MKLYKKNELLSKSIGKRFKGEDIATYYVQVTAEFYKGYPVEAGSEEEAKGIARENFEYDYSSGWDSLELKAEEM